MGLLGIISLAQIWFMPGYLLLYLVRGIHPIDKALLSIPISAVINFFLVYGLVLFDGYTQPVIITLFIVEVLALLLFKLKMVEKIEHSNHLVEKRILLEINLTNIVFGLLALICFTQFINQIGTVFTQGDAVMSWNHWAVSWFNGKIPFGLSWYPQLLPTLYSLTYQFIGDSRIELFAKIAISLYPLVALAIFARIATLWPRERNKILWSAIIFFLLVRRLWGSESNLNGYADFPLAFFCISILYVFALKSTEKEQCCPTSFTLQMLLIIVAVGAGLMKQSGVYLGILAPVIWFAYFRHKNRSQEHIKHFISVSLVIAATYSTWYLFQYWRISTGIEHSNLRNLADIIFLPWYESIVYGFMGFTNKLSWLWVALFVASLAHQKVRYTSIFVVTPFFLLWAAFVPYDYRNLAAVLPLLAISLSYGWVELIGISRKILPVQRFGQAFIQKIMIFVILAGLSIALTNPKYDDDLLQISNSAKKQIGDPEINNFLLAYFEINSAPSLLATPYVEITKIPKIADRYHPFSCRLTLTSTENLQNLDAFLPELNNPAIQQILLLPWCDAKVQNYFSSQPDKYTVIFRHKGAVFYKIRIDLNYSKNK